MTRSTERSLDFTVVGNGITVRCSYGYSVSCTRYVRWVTRTWVTTPFYWLEQRYVRTTLMVTRRQSTTLTAVMVLFKSRSSEYQYHYSGHSQCVIMYLLAENGPQSTWRTEMTLSLACPEDVSRAERAESGRSSGYPGADMT